jgi:hypothetical protein
MQYRVSDTILIHLDDPMAAKAVMPLRIGGCTVNVTNEVVPVDKVHLNPDNPRIRFILKLRSNGKSLTGDELMALIREQPGYDALQKGIRKAEGLYEPVIVRHDGLVVEGNTRATIFKTLHNGNPSDPRWKTMPVSRLPKSVPEHAIAMLMASYHIAGKTVWRPYAQADQIYQLRHTHGRSVPQIADQTRMPEREVEQYLEAYEYLVKEVLPHVTNGNASDILESKFSHALEFVKRKNLEGIRKDPAVRKQLAKLLIEDKIKGAEVRELDKVLKNRKASTALQKTGFKAAKEILGKTDPLAASKLLRDMKSFTHALGKMGQTDIELLKTSAKAREVFLELTETVRNVAAIADIRIRGQ